MVSDRLTGALKEVELPLASALREKNPYLAWLSPDLQLTYPQCGMATAALSLYLGAQGFDDVQRKIISLTHIPLKRENGPYRRHVILLSDGKVIDPTFSQFYGLIGLDTHLAHQFSDMRSLLPERKIALFDLAKYGEFGLCVAEHALVVRPAVCSALADRSLAFYRFNPEVLEKSPADEVRAVFAGIWHPSRYVDFSVDYQTKYYDKEFGGYAKEVAELLQ